MTPIDVTGARVLIVDDNAVNRAILSEQMDSWTFDSCAAESGPEGINVLRAAADFGVAVDCVILDYQMPGMTGADAGSHHPLDAGDCSHADHHADLGRPVAFQFDLSRHWHRSAADQAGAVLGAARSAGDDDPEASPCGRQDVACSRCEATGRRPKRRCREPTRPVATRTFTADSDRLDILVAEDNEVNQLVFTQILADTPYSFEIVGNGRRAVEAFKENAPRMILMDVSMPEMNGIEATGAIRDLEAGRASHVPIVGVTAHALKGDRERCLDAGHGRLPAQADQPQGAAGEGRQVDTQQRRTATQRGLAE